MELENREGLSACIEYVRQHGIELVLVEDSTRLARDLIVAEVCVREFQKAHVRVVSASGGVDLTAGDDSNPTAKLVRQILSAVAEFDRCVINLKLQGARKRKKDKESPRFDPAYRDGRKPYGSRPGEKEQLEFMRALQSEGKNLVEIKAELDRRGMMARGTKKNGPQPWSLGSLARVARRA
jgi:DNA invertase Pin-like site-specific DNA recombinase